MQCPKCRHESPARAKYCEECGASLVRRCECGAELSATAKFCSECGRPADVSGSASGGSSLARLPGSHTPIHLAEKIRTPKAAPAEREAEAEAQQVAEVTGKLEAELPTHEVATFVGESKPVPVMPARALPAEVDAMDEVAERKELGRYKLNGILGKGAMGLVYDGLDPRLGRRIAIKTILKSNLEPDAAKEYSARFIREAQAVARLNHPNIVQIYDFGEEGDLAYLVMEFIKGKELKSFFDANERFELKEVVRIMCELLDALEKAHNAGIIHRDIKPANVMIDARGRTKLTDFGVARVLQEAGSRTVIEKTQAGTMVGTPAYMSPEQIVGGNIDKRTDLFSAGIILYQFITGQRPFTGRGAWTIAKKIMQEEPPSPSTIDGRVPGIFDKVVAKALAKIVDNRFGSAKDFAAALKLALEGADFEADADATEPIKGPMGGGIEALHTAALATAEASGPLQADSTGTVVSEEVELEFWKAIKDGNDPDDFELHVEKFPKGIYTSLAKRKIAKLKGGTAEESGAKSKQAAEQERRETEEAARREVETRTRLAAEKEKMAAALAKREEEIRQREAEAEARREAEAKAAAETEVKREAEAKARAEALAKTRLAEVERVKREAEALLAKREAEAEAKLEAELARREAEAKAKQEAEDKARREAQEKARREADAKARAEAEAKTRKEAEDKTRHEAHEKARREAEAKARAEAEARAKRETEEKAKREAEFAKREAELRDREADAPPKKIPVYVPIIIGVLVAAIGGGVWYYLAPPADEAKQMAEIQKMLDEAKAANKAVIVERENEAALWKQLAEYKLAEGEAKKSGDLAKQRELAEQTKQREAELAKQEELTKQREEQAKKQVEVAKLRQEELAKAKEAAGKSPPKPPVKTPAEIAAEAERVAAEKAAAEKAAAERAAAEKAAVKAAASKAAGKVVAVESPVEKPPAPTAAAEKAPAEKAPPTQVVSVDPLALCKKAQATESTDVHAAVRMYRQLASSGYGQAAARLAQIYNNGEGNVRRDLAEMLTWKQKAEELGVDPGLGVAGARGREQPARLKFSCS
ncbi:MAG: protein kinase [Betaproteobacteria bacterium]|nr:protein kinase [Betaproteobacteria bacterium]